MKIYNLDSYKNKKQAILQARRNQPIDSFPDFIRFEIEEKEDNDPDLSYLGEFTDKWEPGALNHFAKQYGHNGRDNREYKWFVPCNTYASHRKGLIEMKYGKVLADSLAREYVAQDYKRSKDYGTYWYMVGIVVTAYVNDIEIGTASLWGIETDSDESYKTETIEELKHEIMASIDLKAIQTHMQALQTVIDYVTA